MVTRNIIFAVGENGEFGNKGELPWDTHNKEDMLNFRNITLDTGVTICGYKTWESLDQIPLKDRKMIVIDNRVEWDYDYDDKTKVTFISDDFNLGKLIDGSYSVIGGKSLIEMELNSDIDYNVYVTVFDKSYEADVFIDLTLLADNMYTVCSEQKIEGGCIYTFKRGI